MAERKRARGEYDDGRDINGTVVVQHGPKRARSKEPHADAAAKGSQTIEEQLAAGKARAAEFRDRMAAGTMPASSSPSSSIQSPADAARARVEAMKARVAIATARSSAGSEQRTATTLPTTYQSQENGDGLSRARGGLGIGLHPALMGDTGLDGRPKNKGQMTSRFSTTIGNRRTDSTVPKSTDGKGRRAFELPNSSLEELRQNPYIDASVGGVSAAPRGRKSRELLFHQKGKFIAQAAALRRQAHLENMKRRIAESTRKAGLDEDRSEQAFLVPEPPSIEWWDEALVNGTKYPDFNDDALVADKKLKIDTQDSVVTHYVQHPVLLDAPQEKTIPLPKPMFMTKEEQAKKRRQDRTEIRKEKQAKVRLGLEPPEPPKVKKSNLMGVLGEQAVKDPTAVEARVNKEIADRREKHEQANESRKLTKDQRHEKLAANQEKDAAKGILVNVFRIDSLAYGKHRYQIDVNAKQHALTGITIMNPKLNLVIVEGGQYSIAKYKKLMLQRIRWTENAPPSETALESANSHHKDIAEASYLQAEDEKGQLKDLGDNRCVLVWEGEEKHRAFKKWGSKVCETDTEAIRTLEKSKMENMWQLAKNWAFL